MSPLCSCASMPPTSDAGQSRKSVAAAVQRRDIALLFDGRPELVARAGADGAHLTGLEALRAALPALKPDRIAGAGGLRSRHDAMLAAEANADYVMFGEPERRGGRLPFSIEERVAWWAELFQPPCVGYAASSGEIRPSPRQAPTSLRSVSGYGTNQAEGKQVAAAAQRPAAGHRKRLPSGLAWRSRRSPLVPAAPHWPNCPVRRARKRPDPRRRTTNHRPAAGKTHSACRGRARPCAPPPAASVGSPPSSGANPTSPSALSSAATTSPLLGWRPSARSTRTIRSR